MSDADPASSRGTPTQQASPRPPTEMSESEKPGSETRAPSEGSLDSGKGSSRTTGTGVDGSGIQSKSEVMESKQASRLQDPETAMVEPLPNPIDVMYEMLRSRVMLDNLVSGMWTENHENIIKNFLTDTERLLVAYIDPINGFLLENQIPHVPIQQLTYFIKKENASEMTPENFHATIQYGTVMSGHIQSLLRMMQGIYAPIFFENTSWPDSIKNDFSAQLHKFLASLTDTRWKMDGKTVLYIPNEGLRLIPEKAAKDKELVQRLERRRRNQS